MVYAFGKIYLALVRICRTTWISGWSMTSINRSRGTRCRRVGEKIAVGLEYLLTGGGAGADNFLQVGAFAKSNLAGDHPDLQIHQVDAPMINHGMQASERGRRYDPCVPSSSQEQRAYRLAIG